MRILYLLEQAPRPEETVQTGSDLRYRQLFEALSTAGHEVTTTWLRKPGQARSDHSFANGEQLQGLIHQRRPDVVLVGYWELITLLPFEIPARVVLDFVAPRPLEQVFEQPGLAARDLRRLQAALRRCDLLLVGNQKQSSLLLYSLVEAGFDLRERLPIVEVPLGAQPLPRPGPSSSAPLTTTASETASSTSQPPVTLVMAGVSWPWRRDQAWREALVEATRQAGHCLQLVEFRGDFPGHGSPANTTGDAAGIGGIDCRALLPYPEYSRFLAGLAHVGVELADWNVERAHSQSFRSLDFLRHGLPLLCNDYLPLAEWIRGYDAGWVIRTTEELPAVLAEVAQPAILHKKSAAARRLFEEQLTVAATTGPLLRWLQQPSRAERIQPRELVTTEPVLGVPPLGQRLARQWRLVRQVGLARLLKPRQAGQGVLFVTRGDLFPTDHGAAVRTVETARALAEQGLPVGIVTDRADGWYRYSDGALVVQPYPLWTRLLSLPTALHKLLHFSKDIPHSNAFLYLPLTGRAFFWRILAAGRKLGSAILQAEFPAYAQPCLDAAPILENPVVLVQHNVEYRRLRAQLPELSPDQYQRFKAIEIDLCNRVQQVVCVSDADRQTLIDDGVYPEQLATIPHGVRLQAYAAPADPGLRERLGIPPAAILLAFHGTFSYPPNRQALRVFTEELLPRIQSLGREAHVLAIGRDPPDNRGHENIHLLGPVDELAPWLKAADLAVVPLTEGGGTRMKIIDCFAARLPVISTRKGIEGIPVEPGRQALVLDDWQEMAEAIVKLAADQHAREELATSGYEFASALDWSAIAARYRALYSGLG